LKAKLEKENKFSENYTETKEKIKLLETGVKLEESQIK
jgi:hypothetical protein